MTDLGLINKACVSLGLKTEKNSYVRGWHKNCTPAQLVVRMDNGYDLGFQPSGDGSYYCVADFAYTHSGENHGGNLQSLWMQICAKYATEKSLKEAQANFNGANINVRVK